MVAIHPSLVDQINTAYRQMQSGLADVDMQQNRGNTSHNNALRQLAQQRQMDLSRTRADIADKGMTRSGISLKRHANVNQAYDEQNSGQLANFTSLMSELARKRLDLQAGYQEQVANAQRQGSLLNAQTQLGM
jgi:septum formation inhibitor MinC